MSLLTLIYRTFDFIKEEKNVCTLKIVSLKVEKKIHDFVLKKKGLVILILSSVTTSSSICNAHSQHSLKIIQCNTIVYK